MAIDWDNVEIVAEDENIVRLTDWNSVEIISEDEEVIKLSDSDIINVDAQDRMIIFGGERGETGPQGPVGPAGTVRVGTTTTLPAGSDATVVNRGTPQNALLDFGIPKGVDGDNAPVWGNISGDITDQTDLVSALADKADTSDLGELAFEDDAPYDSKEYVRKNGEWSEATGGIASVLWGDIEGTLSNQTDLVTALNAKADTSDLNNYYTETETNELLKNKADSVSIADEYDPTHTYTVDDLVMFEGLLYICIGEALSQLSTTPITAEGHIVTGEYYTYGGSLYIATRSVSWSWTDAEKPFNELLNDGFIVLVPTTTYDPFGTYSIGDIVSKNNDFYELTAAHATFEETTVEEQLASSGSSGTWGSISGTLSNQTDLQNALDAKANTADLGDLASQDTVDYSTEVTNKPTLGNLASQDTVDYTTDITNLPTLGDLSELDSIDYTSNKLTNKPTLGSLADQDTVDYATEVTNKPTLGTMSSVNDATSDEKAYARKDGAWYDLDGRYYTESEVDSALSGKVDTDSLDEILAWLGLVYYNHGLYVDPDQS